MNFSFLHYFLGFFFFGVHLPGKLFTFIPLLYASYISVKLTFIIGELRF